MCWMLALDTMGTQEGAGVAGLSRSRDCSGARDRHPVRALWRSSINAGQSRGLHNCHRRGRWVHDEWRGGRRAPCGPASGEAGTRPSAGTGEGVAAPLFASQPTRHTHHQRGQRDRSIITVRGASRRRCAGGGRRRRPPPSGLGPSQGRGSISSLRGALLVPTLVHLHFCSWQAREAPTQWLPAPPLWRSPPAW